MGHSDLWWLRLKCGARATTCASNKRMCLQKIKKTTSENRARTSWESCARARGRSPRWGWNLVYWPLGKDIIETLNGIEIIENLFKEWGLARQKCAQKQYQRLVLWYQTKNNYNFARKAIYRKNISSTNHMLWIFKRIPTSSERARQNILYMYVR